MTYYLIDVYGGTDPELVGPYSTEDERDIEAKTIRNATQTEEDALFRLDVDDAGKPYVYPYVAGFFEV